MELFKMSHTEWAVITDSAREKKRLFRIIDKRDRSAIYFLPEGTKQEQFIVSPSEADLINQKWMEGDS